MNVIQSPQTPFIGQIPGGCRVGTQVVINGHIPHWFVHRFDVNLFVGHNATQQHTDRADIALHFNPRFDGDHCVILNDRRNGNWGQHMQMAASAHFQKGSDFELQITVEDAYFRITVNGQHFANFPHRQSFHEIGLLHVAKGVEIRSIQFNQLGGGGGGFQPAPAAFGVSTVPPSMGSGFTPAPVMQSAYTPGPTFPSSYNPPGSYPPGHPQHRRF